MSSRALGRLMTGSTVSLLILTSTALAENALNKCVAAQSEEMLQIVKRTVGLSKKTQLDALRGLVRHVCVDQLELAAGMDREEAEAIIERETRAAVPSVFGAGYLEAHPLE